MYSYLGFPLYGRQTHRRPQSFLPRNGIPRSFPGLGCLGRRKHRRRRTRTVRLSNNLRLFHIKRLVYESVANLFHLVYSSTLSTSPSITPQFGQQPKASVEKVLPHSQSSKGTQPRLRSKFCDLPQRGQYMVPRPCMSTP